MSARNLEVALADLSADELATSVQAAAEKFVGVARAASLRTYIAAVLDEDEQVARLSGSPTDVIEHLDVAQRHRLIRSTAHRAVLDTALLESSAVGEALGRSGTNGREAASRLRLASRLVGIKQGSRYLFPAFQFDLAARGVPAVVSEVNQLLRAVDDPWGVASWWISQTPRLVGRAPRELIGTSEESDLLILAQAETAE